MTPAELHALATRLTTLLDADPAEAVRQARAIDLPRTGAARWRAASLRASILIDGRAGSGEAIEEAVALFREVHAARPQAATSYNLANALAARAKRPPDDETWLDHQERTREARAEARRLYWAAAHDDAADLTIRTEAWTNLANQFSYTYRLGEAHDARLAALAIDPRNGVAAGLAALDLLWLYEQGGCSELTRIEAGLLAKVAREHEARVRELAGAKVAARLAALADELGEAPERAEHIDPFLRWIERERLTLAPAVELVDPSLGKVDWLMLPGIMERETPPETTKPPPVFAMFNVLKADFIVARDLAWRASSDTGWPATGRFADTLDFATYGPGASALTLAHRTTLDLLDKVAVAANHHFGFGVPHDDVSFGKLWRPKATRKNRAQPLSDRVATAIRAGAYALYGLAELADDYEADGAILRSHKDLRNAGTHRFVVLHDPGDPTDVRESPEIAHHGRERFVREVLRALRVARSAIQMLTLAIRQHERTLALGTSGLVGTLVMPDYDEDAVRYGEE